MPFKLRDLICQFLKKKKKSHMSLELYLQSSIPATQCGLLSSNVGILPVHGMGWTMSFILDLRDRGKESSSGLHVGFMHLFLIFSKTGQVKWRGEMRLVGEDGRDEGWPNGNRMMVWHQITLHNNTVSLTSACFPSNFHSLSNCIIQS